MPKLNQRSEDNLRGVHPTLERVVRRAAELLDPSQPFTITEGLRSFERQLELVKQGKSKTMKSAHLRGYAVDVYPGSWQREAFHPIRDAMFAAAAEIGVRLVWGGDFNGDGETVGSDNWDCPHFELDKRDYK